MKLTDRDHALLSAIAIGCKVIDRNSSLFAYDWFLNDRGVTKDANKLIDLRLLRVFGTWPCHLVLTEAGRKILSGHTTRKGNKSWT